jgi:CoA:oxalate CoA-transferase
MKNNSGPLKGIIVLDLTRVLVGPYCTMVLSDLGARVIKVEAPETGDDSRSFGPFIKDYSAYFMSLNRGKESIALNLKDKDDKKIFDKILSKADVLVENFRPGTLDKWGYSWDVLKKKYPRLIYASASGFGQTGPLKSLPAYDMVVQGMGGLMSVTGQPDGKPTRVGTSIGDITAGLFTTIGINAALFDRAKTGKGTKIDVSMLDCQIAILENAIARYFSSGEIPKPMGSRHPSITPFEAYKTKDSFIIVAAGNDKLFENLCNALDCKEYIKDKRFVSNKLRNVNAEDLKVILEKYLIKDQTDNWIKLFTKMNIPCGPIYNIKQAVENPQITFRNMIVSSDHKKIGKFKMAGNPIKMSNYKDPKTRGEIPELDQHRKKILKDFKIKI